MNFCETLKLGCADATEQQNAFNCIQELKEEKRDLARLIVATLNHARIFISTRQKMHKDGIKLYDKQLAELEQIVKEGEEDDSKNSRDNSNCGGNAVQGD